MILGSGSASFEIMRSLVERLPVMITPKWVHNPVQPIAIRNVLGYLVGCLEHDETKGETFDIGGPEIITYRKLFDIYAEEAGLRRRLIIPVLVLTPRLSSYWIHLVTPVSAAIARPLAEGLRNPVICRENRIREIIPQELLDCRTTVRLALQRIRQEQVDTCWMDAGRTVPPEWLYCGGPEYAGGTVRELAYGITLAATPEEVWKPPARIAGRTAGTSAPGSGSCGACPVTKMCHADAGFRFCEGGFKSRDQLARPHLLKMPAFLFSRRLRHTPSDLRLTPPGIPGRG